MATPSARELLAEANRCAERNDLAGTADVLSRFVRRHASHPEAAHARLRLGQVLVRVGRYDDGIAQLRRLVRADPSSMIARDSLVLAYHYAGRFEDQENAIDETLAIDPDHAEAIARRANLLMYAGQADRAAEMLDAAHARGVRDPLLDLAFAGVAPRVGRVPEAIDRLRGLLGDAGTPPMARAETLLELARLLERSGDFDGAWDAAAQANALRPAGFDPDMFDRVVDATLGAMSPGALAALPAPVDRGEDVVLVVGAPRSGTTLVEQMLAAHPSCATAGELPVFQHAAETLGLAGDPGGWRPESVRRADIAGASGHVLAALRSRAGKAARRIDKQPANWLHVGLAAAITPGARVIQVHRDPRDTAVSLFFRHFAAGHDFSTRLDWIGRYLRTCARAMRHWGAMHERGELPVGLTDTRYESLIADTEPEARRLVGFLGLEWDAACLAFHERRAVVPTLTPEQAGSGVYASSVERWRRYEGRLGPLLEALGDEAPTA